MSRFKIGRGDFAHEYVKELVQTSILNSNTRLKDAQTINQFVEMIREDVDVIGGVQSIFELKKAVFKCFARYGFYDAAFVVAQGSNEKEES